MGEGSRLELFGMHAEGNHSELWSLLLPPTHKQQSFSLLNRHLIDLFQLEAVVGE